MSDTKEAIAIASKSRCELTDNQFRSSIALRIFRAVVNGVPSGTLRDSRDRRNARAFAAIAKAKLPAALTPESGTAFGGLQFSVS